MKVSLLSTRSDEQGEALDHFCSEYRRRNDAYSLVFQLHKLMISVQKHRGYSIALLAGDESYTKKFAELQRVLERRLAVLESFAKVTGLLHDKDKHNLHLAWQTIRHDWQDDNLNDNFELHCHFVEQLLGMTSSVLQTLEPPLVEEFPNAANEKSVVPYPNSFKKLEVLHFVVKHLPSLIESLAKLRGLSAYAASEKNSRNVEDRKLKFLLENTRNGSREIRNKSERLLSLCSDEYAELKEITIAEIKLDLLLSQIENDLLRDDSQTSSDPVQLFVRATEIIETYWSVVNSGLNLARYWHELEFNGTLNA